MNDRHDNPLGVKGFEFVEFAAPDAAILHQLFSQMGFAPVARHRQCNITLYRQGGISFLVNEEQGSHASEFAELHGPCCTGFGLRVNDASEALRYTCDRGAESMQEVTGTAIDSPRIRGIGGSILYLTDRVNGIMFAAEYQLLEGADPNHAGYGMTSIDHLTHNVFFGNMDQWADFYTRLFGFREVRYFDIKGQLTGLKSRAMSSPDGAISIPINQSEDPKSQINEYLDEYKGEGVQHIALYTEDIYATVESMHEAGVRFLETPATYYEIIDRRIEEHVEDVERMRRNGILIDADEDTRKKLLLQIFTETVLGPIFFEIIQRKGNKGFGEGNFTALFESIELDQMRRGVL